MVIGGARGITSAQILKPRKLIPRGTAGAWRESVPGSGVWTVPGSGVGAGVAGPLCPVTVRPSVSGATFTAFFRWLQSSSRGRLRAPGPARGIPKGGVSLSVSIQMWVTQTRSSCKGRLCIAHACMHTHIHTHMCTHMHAHPITPHPTGGPAGLGVARLPPGEGDAASSKVKARLMEGSWGSEPLLSPRGNWHGEVLGHTQYLRRSALTYVQPHSASILLPLDPGQVPRGYRPGPHCVWPW